MRIFALCATSALLIVAVTSEGWAREACGALAAERSRLVTGSMGRFAEAAARQRSEIARAQGMMSRCALFASSGCAALPDSLRAMRANLDRLERAARSEQPHLARVEARMARAGCGTQQAASGRPSSQTPQMRPTRSAVPSTSATPQLATSFFPVVPERRLRDTGPVPELAPFGDMRSDRRPPPPRRPSATHGRGLYRTLCVRTCDGYHWPINFSVPRAAFERDAAACQAACSNQAVQLFVHRNPGEWSEQAVSLNGRPYTALPNAFRYRTVYDRSCQCRPATEPRSAGAPGAALMARTP